MRIGRNAASRLSPFFILFTLAIGFGVYAAAGAATISELEADLKNCLKSRDDLAVRMRAEYQQIGQLTRQCQESYKRLEKLKNDPPRYYRDARDKYKEKEAEYLRHYDEWKDIESQVTQKGGTCEQDATCMTRLTALRKSYNEGTPLWREYSEARKALVKEIDAQSDAYDNCQKQLKEHTSVYNSLWPVWNSTDTECTSLQGKLNTARQQQQQQQQPKGKIRIFMVGSEPREVGNPVRFDAEILSDPGATRQTRYIYEWYLNGVPTVRSDSPTYTFQAPLTGVNTILVMVFKTGDGGRTWQAVGEAYDKFYVQWGVTPPIGENKAAVTIGLRDAKTNQPVTGWIDFGGKELSRGSYTYTYRNVPYGNVQVRAGAEGYSEKAVTLTIDQNPFSTFIALEKPVSPTAPTGKAEVTPVNITIRWKPLGSNEWTVTRLTRKATNVYGYDVVHSDGTRGDATSNFQQFSGGKRQMEIAVTWKDKKTCDRNYFRGPIEGKGVQGKWSGSILSCGSGDFTAEWTDEVTFINP
jgi:hypothetical protein